jgi:hypothetical protein
MEKKIKRYFGKTILATDPDFNISSGSLAENFRRWHSSVDEGQKSYAIIAVQLTNGFQGSQFRNRQPANHTAGPLPRQYTVRSGRLHVPPAFLMLSCCNKPAVHIK